MKTTILAISLSLLSLLSLSAMAITQQDVDFAQRQCAQRGEPYKCRQARDMATTFQREQRDKLEHDAAVKAGKPMAGSVNIDINSDYGGDGKGAYRWNSGRSQYCYHNSNGSVQRCVK